MAGTALPFSLDMFWCTAQLVFRNQWVVEFISSLGDVGTNTRLLTTTRLKDEPNRLVAVRETDLHYHLVFVLKCIVPWLVSKISTI